MPQEGPWVVDLIETNKEKLLKVAVMGEIVHPIGRRFYSTTWDGSVKVSLGMDGITYNVRVGDPVFGWVSADHVEPGVSLVNKNEVYDVAFGTLSCIGNEAKVVSGEAKGSLGYVTGKHSNLLAWFRDEDIAKMAIGDKVQVKVWGVGLKIHGFDDVKVEKIDPELLESMGITVEKGRLVVPVSKELPAYIMGSGIGHWPVAEYVDYDIQTTCPEAISELGLGDLRLGDVVALQDQYCGYGRGYLKGAMTIGVVIHGASDIAGHGPGVNPVITCMGGKVVPRIDSGANIARYLGIRGG
jgi:hypothetical protein